MPTSPRTAAPAPLIVEPRTAAALAVTPLPPALARVLVTGRRPTARLRRHDGRRPGPDPDEVPRLDTDLAAIMYTSGSTGRPKGVMLSHRNILAGARSVARYLGLREDDRLLSILPYSFDYGLNQLTTMMLTGGTVVHQPVAMAAEIVASRRRATAPPASPPCRRSGARSSACSTQRRPRFPSLRRVTNSGG